MRGQNLLPGQCYVYAIGISEINKVCFTLYGSKLASGSSCKPPSFTFITSTFTDIIVNFDICLRRNCGQVLHLKSLKKEE